MSYEIQFKRAAIKSISKINEPHYSAILKSINQLSENPRPFGYKKLTGRDGFRIRIGNYRVIYEIFDSILVIEIVNVGSRGGIYEE